MLKRNCHLLCVAAVFLVCLCLDSIAINSVGIPCRNNSTCTGENEYCQNITWLSPTCQSGLCNCLPCYTTGDFSGYSWLQNPCAPMVPLTIGEPCFGGYNELILPINAECAGGIVLCKDGYIPSDSICLAVGRGLGDGEPCETYADCAGELQCSLDNRCSCWFSYERYDPIYGKCVKRELGDSCSQDADCRPSGGQWQGFTWSMGACVNGTCICPTKNQVTAAYLDGITGVMKTKEICIIPSGQKNLGSGSVCTVDPIYESDSVDVAVCASDLVCAACPEDGSWAIGKCRKPISNVPSPVCYTRPTAPPPLSRNRADSATSVNKNELYRQGWTDLDIMIAQVVNETYPDIKTLRPCSSANSSCRANEKCLTPLQCGRGFCFCAPPSYVNGSGSCVAPMTTTSLSTSSQSLLNTTSTTTRITPPGANSVSFVSTMAYYSRCTSEADCSQIGVGIPGALVPNGLICATGITGTGKYCQCSGEQLIWRVQYQQCQLRDYGDPCTVDKNCDNGLYTRYGIGGHRCAGNTCGCAVGFTAVKLALLMASWGSSFIPPYVYAPDSNRTYCANNTQLISGVTAGGNCTLNILNKNNTLTKVCQNGLVCLGCPLDMLHTPQRGICANITFPKPPTTTTTITTQQEIVTNNWQAALQSVDTQINNGSDQFSGNSRTYFSNNVDYNNVTPLIADTIQQAQKSGTSSSKPLCNLVLIVASLFACMSFSDSC